MTQVPEEVERGVYPDFVNTLNQLGINITKKEIKVLQINLGKLCNLSCKHCHIDAGPKRIEVMNRETAERIVELINSSTNIETVDITGGAPELNPNFKYLISKISEQNIEIICRSNLCVLLEKGQEITAHFLKKHKVKIIASLPCYTKANVEKQRGKNVFEKSLSALRLLNSLGYGKNNNELTLNLVYNPGGAFLPGSQNQLEKDYKTKLGEDFGIKFNQLYTITNMPIAKFADYLQRENLTEGYKNLLRDNFNAEAAQGVMCTEMISIAWDGSIYDCDFNQAINLTYQNKKRSIWEIQNFKDHKKNIAFDDHCYGCTAGAGSSCTGTIY